MRRKPWLVLRSTLTSSFCIGSGRHWRCSSSSVPPLACMHPGAAAAVLAEQPVAETLLRAERAIDAHQRRSRAHRRSRGECRPPCPCPVPLSPTSSTGVRTAQSFLICWISFLALALWPMSRLSISLALPGRQRGMGGALGIELAELHAALERGDEFVDPERLLQVVEGPELERLDRAVGAGVGRHDDDHAVGIVELELLEQRDAVHRLHVDVGEHEIELLGLVAGERLLAVGGKRGGKPGRLDDRIEHLVDREQVVDDENSRHGRDYGSPANTLEAAGARLTSPTAAGSAA